MAALTVLSLGFTAVTDAGLQELARAGPLLGSLTALDLTATPVTDAGVAAIKARFPELTIYR